MHLTMIAPETLPKLKGNPLACVHNAAGSDWTGEDEGILKEQLARTISFFGEEGYARLREAFVIVVGVGGVGALLVLGLHSVDVVSSKRDTSSRRAFSFSWRSRLAPKHDPARLSRLHLPVGLNREPCRPYAGP